jgi:hypothetical protein
LINLKVNKRKQKRKKYSMMREMMRMECSQQQVPSMIKCVKHKMGLAIKLSGNLEIMML